MYNRLTKSELQIIEQTRQEGEELAKTNAKTTSTSESQMTKGIKATASTLRSMLIWAGVFIFMIILAYLLLWLSQGFAKG